MKSVKLYFFADVDERSLWQAIHFNLICHANASRYKTPKYGSRFFAACFDN